MSKWSLLIAVLLLFVLIRVLLIPLLIVCDHVVGNFCYCLRQANPSPAHPNYFV